MDADIEQGSQPPMTFELRRTPFWTPGFIFFLGVIGIFSIDLITVMLHAIAQNGPPELVLQLLLGIGLLVATGCGLVIQRGIVRWRPIAPMVFHDAQVDLPTSMQSLGVRSIPYREILSVGARGVPPRIDLLIETRRRIFVFPLVAFVDPADLERAAAEVGRRIVELPEGVAMLEQAERRRLLAHQAITIRPMVTQALLGIILVIFANQVLTGGMAGPFGFIQWGASVPALVRNGEYFRLLSASFLHAGLIHLALNGLALYVLGSLLERLMGWPRFLLLYLGAGLGATCASAFFGGVSWSVGASGAIFGLLGGLAVANWRFRTELPLGFRQPLRWWIIIIGLNAALPLLPLLMPMLLPQIDVWAHAAGFVVGVGLALSLMPRRIPVQLGMQNTPVIYAATFGLIALYGLGLASAVRYAAEFDNDGRRRVVEALAADTSIGPESANALAWELATDQESEEADLALALALARRALDEEPEIDAYRDTLATASYRLGKLDHAITEERRIVERVHDPSAFVLWARQLVGGEDSFMATQLARFLAARVARDGPMASGGFSADSVSLVFEPGSGDPEDSRAIQLNLGDSVHGAFVVYALVTRGDQRLGLVRARVGVGAPNDATFDLGGRHVESLSGRRVGLDIALIEPLPEGASIPNQVEWRFWSNDPRADQLP